MPSTLQISLSIFIVLVNFTRSTVGWGSEGHIIATQVAQEFLTDSALRAVCSLVPSCNLSDLATWADGIRDRYPWSTELHYVNTEDCPPLECSLFPKRDCPDGRCVLGAIRNYTTQLLLMMNSSEPHRDRDRDLDRPPHHRYNYTEALMFLVHFIGDVHQPLHVSGRDEGGNSFDVYFYGKLTNLHTLWDSGIVTKRTKEDGGQYFYFLNELLSLISGIWANETMDWKKCFTDPFFKEPVHPSSAYYQLQSSEFFRHNNTNNNNNDSDNKTPPLNIEAIDQWLCPEQWALESVAENCEGIWPTSTCSAHKRYSHANMNLINNNNKNNDTNNDTNKNKNNTMMEGKIAHPHLSDDYYYSFMPLINIQIAKAGIRMAHVLNSIWPE